MPNFDQIRHISVETENWISWAPRKFCGQILLQPRVFYLLVWCTNNPVTYSTLKGRDSEYFASPLNTVCADGRRGPCSADYCVRRELEVRFFPTAFGLNYLSFFVAFVIHHPEYTGAP